MRARKNPSLTATIYIPSERGLQTTIRNAAGAFRELARTVRDGQPFPFDRISQALGQLVYIRDKMELARSAGQPFSGQREAEASELFAVWDRLDDSLEQRGLELYVQVGRR